MNPTQLWLGVLAGVTIFFGLPVAILPRVTERVRAFLSAISTGILIFLLVEIMGKILEGIEELFESATAGFQTLKPALGYSGLLVVGLIVGLMGLAVFERIFIRTGKDELPPKARAEQVATMIAISIGLHNLSEGLAIGHEYSFGAVRLALVLAVGFGLHNATEGFGIAAPLSGHRPKMSFLLLMGLIGGGPTVLGVILGSFWVSQPAEILFLSLAAGAILYIVGELLHLGRVLKGEALAEAGLLIGFFLGFATEMLITLAG